MNEVVEILKSAKELIADPNRWTRNLAARNNESYWVDPKSKEAIRWCALGAIERFSSADYDTNIQIEYYLYSASAALYNGISISMINDAMGHGAVMKLFDRAIELAEK